MQCMTEFIFLENTVSQFKRRERETFNPEKFPNCVCCTKEIESLPLTQSL